MKHISITIVCLFVIATLLQASLHEKNSGYSNSNEENPPSLLEPGKRWNIGRNIINECPMNPYNRWLTYYLSIDGDTTINGNAFKMLYQSSDSLFVENSVLYYIRDGRKGEVFITNNAMEESLLFDFNLEAGDTMTIHIENIDMPNNIFILVDSIGIITLNDGKEYKAQYIYYCDDYEKEDLLKFKQTYKSDIWVEGIGALKYGFIPPVTITGGNDGKVLLCHSFNNELVYQNPEYNTCEMRTSIKESLSSPILIKVITLGNGLLQLNTEGSISGTLSLFDINGRKLSDNIQVNGSTQVQTHHIGLHIFRFTNKKGQVQTGKVMVR